MKVDWRGPRASGRTTRQIQGLRVGGVFIAGDVTHCREAVKLANTVNRNDVLIKTIGWVGDRNWRGAEFSDWDIDHAIILEGIENLWFKEFVEYADRMAQGRFKKEYGPSERWPFLYAVLGDKPSVLGSRKRYDAGSSSTWRL